MAILLLNYSRSGGTLISSVLGKLKNVVLVSEVNPVSNASSSVKEQVKKWYGIDISSGSFKEMVIELNGYCVTNNKILIIRDFSFVDFTPHLKNDFIPSNHFSIILELQKEISLNIFSFVRNGIDVWISRNCPFHFSDGYLIFVKNLVGLNIPIFKYENFCAEPEKELIKICKTIGISYDPSALIDPNGHNNVTGDNQLKSTSRGRKMNMIKTLKRKQIPEKWVKRALLDKNLLEANRILNYNFRFNESEFETNDPDWINSLKWALKRYRNPSHFHEF